MIIGGLNIAFGIMIAIFAAMMLADGDLLSAEEAHTFSLVEFYC